MSKIKQFLLKISNKTRSGIQEESKDKICQLMLEALKEAQKAGFVKSVSDLQNESSQLSVRIYIVPDKSSGHLEVEADLGLKDYKNPLINQRLDFNDAVKTWS